MAAKKSNISRSFGDRVRDVKKGLLQGAALGTLPAIAVIGLRTNSFGFSQSADAGQNMEAPDMMPPINQQPAIYERRDFAPEEILQPLVSTEQIFEDFIAHLMLREGHRNTVYLDTRGNPTVGVGHLVLPEDNLKVGDTISDVRVQAFLEKDARKAFNAALKQAGEIGVSDPHFIMTLGSVNFQLGTAWRDKFPNTWQMITNGEYERAANALQNTRWMKQTPVRVKDFQNALRLLSQPLSWNIADHEDQRATRTAFNDSSGIQDPFSLTKAQRRHMQVVDPAEMETNGAAILRLAA